MTNKPNRMELFLLTMNLRWNRFFNWLGVREKTLWDWLRLILIPIIIATTGFYFTESQHRTDMEIENERQMEAALQKYLDDMTYLVLSEDLHNSNPEDKVRVIASARTLTVMDQLDVTRKITVLEFLRSAELISKDPVIDLSGLDLSNINLSWKFLNDISLSGVILTNANLSDAYLENVDLSFADMSGADMTGARLNNANLVGATLSNANLRHSDLSGADLRYSRLDGAYMIYAKLNGAILVEPEVLQNTQKEFNTYVWLSGAYLRGANLRNADLTNAVISLEQLEDVYSLDGVTMPDGSMYDGRFDKETEQADK